MSAIKFIQGYARKSLTTNKGSGITTIPGAMQSEAKAGEIVALLQRAGIPMNQLDDFIRSEADVAKFLNIIEAANGLSIEDCIELIQNILWQDNSKINEI